MFVRGAVECVRSLAGAACQAARVVRQATCSVGLSVKSLLPARPSAPQFA